MESIVRKATELGAARIIPLESERTQVHLEGDRSDRKIEKWQIAALEAAKHCGNPWLPEITPLQGAAAFMESARGYDLKLIASLQPGAISLKSALAAYRSAQNRAPQKCFGSSDPRAISHRPNSAWPKLTVSNPLPSGHLSFVARRPPYIP